MRRVPRGEILPLWAATELLRKTRGGRGVPPAQTEKEKTAGEPGLASTRAPDRGSPAARYGLAAAAVALAAGAKWIIDPALEAESPFLLFVVAIVVGA
jgi:hypothetical protein